MDTAKVISDWITCQLESGKTEGQLDGTVFYKGSDTYTIVKSRRKSGFDLKVKFGNAVDLVQLENA